MKRHNILSKIIYIAIASIAGIALYCLDMVMFANNSAKQNIIYNADLNNTSSEQRSYNGVIIDSRGSKNEEPEAPAKPIINMLTDEFEANVITVNNTDFEMSETCMQTISVLIKQYQNRCAFYLVTLDMSMSIGYNPDAVFSTHSTIKAPYALYCYKEIAKGEKSLQETKAYEKRFWVDGSGTMKNQPTGKIYTIREILFNMIHESDNVAYYMLLDHFKKDGYNDMLDELGCTNLHLLNGRNWSETSPRDALIVWKSIYEFSKECEEGRIYFDDLLNARYSYIGAALPEYKSAHKSGWTKTGRHDTGMVFADTPYYIAVMTDSTGNSSDMAFFKSMVRALDDVVKEYKLYTDADFLTPPTR